jgi:hypothetical protein
MTVRLALRDVSGRTITESKSLVIDGTAPVIHPELPNGPIGEGQVTIAARTDADVIFLSVRVDDGPPVPLRWDDGRRLSSAHVLIPQGSTGRHELFFEAMDAAGNHGFARSGIEVR